jgi:membrane protease YdiL (CAAX protease family)
MKKISLISAASLFAATSFIIYVNLYFCMPHLIKNGVSILLSYLLLFYFPFIIIFLLALFLYRIEGNELLIKKLFERFRIKKLDRKDLVYTIGLLVFGILSYFLLLPVGKYFASLSFFSPPDYFPAEINPNKLAVSGQFMGYSLKGAYWIPALYFVGWLFNIIGEEFLWRGYLLPRQELIYGKYTWLIHGIMWSFWHWFWKWNIISIMPFAVALSYTVQKTKNTSVGILAHGIMNFIPLVMIIIRMIG